MKRSDSPSIGLASALRACRRSVLAVAGFSLFVNLLLLAPSLYMLQVYDRVLASRSESTLLLLTVLIAGALLVLGALEWIRGQILLRVGVRLDMILNARLFDALFALGRRQPGQRGIQPLHDLHTLRQFIASGGLTAFFDIPWLPVYVGLLFLLDPLLGWLVTGGAAVALLITLSNEPATQKPLAAANLDAVAAGQYAQSCLRNAEVLDALGMLPAVRERWLERHCRSLALQVRAGGRAGVLGAASRTWRLLLQSLILGAGAYLAIEQTVTPGAMIAAAIVTSRALAPVDLLASSWKNFVNARLAYRRLNDLLRQIPPEPETMALPRPEGRVEVDKLVVVPPGADKAALQGISFSLAAGETLAIIGPSAAGKSTLARALLGIWPVRGGSVRLDGADVSTWNRAELGPWLGYLPQDIELFGGTASENIARFGPVDPEKVVAAARQAGMHDLILQLPKGYDTPIGEAGCTLSGGQRQRIGLARALYGDPVLIVLDEPNSNLDTDGESALVQAIRELKSQRRTVVLITHRPSLLAGIDKVLMLKDGRMHLFGPRDQVMAQFDPARSKPAIAAVPSA